MKQSVDVIKEMVNQEVYRKVDLGTDLFQKAVDADKGFQKAERAVKVWKDDPGRWEVRVNCDGTNILELKSDDPFSDLTGAVVKQLLELVSAIHFTERLEAVKEFNKSLEEVK